MVFAPRINLAKVPADSVANVRDRYLAAEVIPSARVLTLPVAIVLSGSLYWLFTRLF